MELKELELSTYTD